MSFLTERLANPVYTDSCSDTVNIPKSVSHDKDLVPGGDDLLQRLRLYPCLHAGCLLHLLCLAAVIHNISGHLHNRLITASSKGQIDRVSCKLIILCVRQAIHAKTDAQRNGHLIADVYRFRFGEKGKMRLLQLRQCFLAENNQVTILLHLTADSVNGCDVFVDLTVNQRNQNGFTNILQPIQSLIVVIDIDKTYDNALVVHFLDGQPLCGLIKQIQCNQRSAVAAVRYNIRILHHRVHRNPPHLYAKAASLIGNLETDPVLPGRKSILRQRREKGADLPARCLFLVHNTVKFVVGPDNPSCIIQNAVRKLQILQKSFLNLPVFRRKTDHFIDDQSPAVHAQRNNHHKITNGKNKQHQT